MDFDKCVRGKVRPLMISKRRYNDYCAIRKLIKWLRAEVLKYAELTLSGDKDAFKLLRSRILDLFGQAWGAEKMLKEIFDNDQHQNGQAGNDFETCRKGDAYDT